jgi:hypothetical protein
VKHFSWGEEGGAALEDLVRDRTVGTTTATANITVSGRRAVGLIAVGSQGLDEFQKNKWLLRL